jgi:hypothetical protein
LTAPFHVTPIAIGPRTEGEGVIAALAWTGSDAAEAAPWKIARNDRGVWTLDHRQLGSWTIRHPRLPALPV